MYPYIDMHCDTLLQAYLGRPIYDCAENMLDVRRMVAAGQGAQFFAVFFPPEGTPEMPSDDEYFAAARNTLLTAADEYGDVLAMAYNAADIERNLAKKRASAILTIEDGRAVRGDMQRLRGFYGAGVRAIGLTWNSSNCFGFPNSRDGAEMQRGLTEFGRDAIAEMNALGMLIDVSHLSDGGFDDVLALSKKPVVATHSNSRQLCGHPRNLTDAMVRRLAQGGGVTGLNFCPEFLTEDGLKQCLVDDLCRHVLHIINVGGEDCVGLGTDFDGIDGTFEVGHPTEMHLLFEVLEVHGLTPRQLEKLAFGNVLRVIRDVM